MRTLIVLFFVSLLAFFMITFEAFATTNSVAETEMDSVEWTLELDVINPGSQDISIIKNTDTEAIEIARRCTRHDPRCIRFD